MLDLLRISPTSNGRNNFAKLLFSEKPNTVRGMHSKRPKRCDSRETIRAHLRANRQTADRVEWDEVIVGLKQLGADILDEPVPDRLTKVLRRD